MKGIVFNLLETLVAREYSEDAWEALLQTAGVDGAYTSLGSYPDEQMSRLVGAAAQSLHKSEAEILRWFGQGAMPILAGRYPQFFDRQASTRAFLLTLNDIIHPEVRKLYPGADVPMFEFDTGASGALLVTYRSPRKLCALAHGFVEGAANHYGEAVGFEHLECMHRGHDQCLFQITFN